MTFGKLFLDIYNLSQNQECLVVKSGLVKNWIGSGMRGNGVEVRIKNVFGW